MEDKDLVSLYMEDISKYKILTKEEEEELLKKVKTGDLEAKNKLIVSNLRLVISIAKNYSNKGMNFIDLISEGNFGLIHSIDKFDISKGYRFSTYAVWWIKQAITKALMCKVRKIRIPSYKYDLLNRINRITVRELMKTGEYPTNEEIGKELNITPEKVEEILIEFQDVMSLNEEIGENLNLEDVVLDKYEETLEDKLMKEVTKKNVYQMLEDLTLREREILMRRYGLAGYRIHTLEEVGLSFNITRERVRQIEKKSLEKLKKKYCNDYHKIVF